MELRESDSLVLKPMDYREKDCIIHFLTREYGKKSAILYGAKSIRSKQRAMAEPFVRLRMQFMEKPHTEMVGIRGVDLLHSYPSLRKNYRRFLHACYFSELLLTCMIPENESGSYFELLENALNNLELSAGELHSDRMKTLVEVKMEFELMLLKLLGVFPELKRCVMCGRELWDISARGFNLKHSETQQLDVPQGGLRCRSCRATHPDVIPLQPGSLKFLIHIHESIHNHQSPRVRPTRQNLVEIDKLTHSCIRHHFRRIPKSYAMLKEKGSGGIIN